VLPIAYSSSAQIKLAEPLAIAQAGDRQRHDTTVRGQAWWAAVQLNDIGSNAMNQIAQFLRNEEGAAVVEYGLLVALIAAVIVAVVVTLGTRVKAAFTTVCNALTGGEGSCS
jgi:pilus assembly protein Flp/PilA